MLLLLLLLEIMFLFSSKLMTKQRRGATLTVVELQGILAGVMAVIQLRNQGSKVGAWAGILNLAHSVIAIPVTRPTYVIMVIWAPLHDHAGHGCTWIKCASLHWMPIRISKWLTASDALVSISTHNVSRLAVIIMTGLARFIHSGTVITTGTFIHYRMMPICIPVRPNRCCQSATRADGQWGGSEMLAAKIHGGAPFHSDCTCICCGLLIRDI